MKEVSCVVSGSFTKAKNRIDRAIQVFKEAGFNVLSPREGGLFYPSDTLWTPGSFPLKEELEISEFQAKQRHMQAISRADFVYFMTPNGYVGTSGAMEAAIAHSYHLPMYASEFLDRGLDDGDGHWIDYCELFEVRSPEEVINIWQKIDSPKIYLPWYGKYILTRIETDTT